MFPTLVTNARDKIDNRGTAIYIGRGSKWGNPFHLHKFPGRLECIEAYAKWLAKQPQLLADLPQIRGKTLKCFCHPEMCHGDILAICADITGMDRLNAYVSAVMRCYGPSCRSVALLCVPEEHRKTVRDIVIINRERGKRR